MSKFDEVAIRERNGKRLRPAALSVLALLSLLPSTHILARPQETFQAVTDRITYNAGEIVRVKIASTAASESAYRSYRFNIRYMGDAKPVAVGLNPGSTDAASPGYHFLWKTPADARTGRYEIDLRIGDPTSSKPLQIFPSIASFVVHRQSVEIIASEVGQSFYSPGDSIACSVKIENLGNQTLSGLRLEFSERYWPWISQQTARIGQNIQQVQSDIQLRPHQPTMINSPKCAIAANVTERSIKQYVAVLWDHNRKNVYALRFTPLVFINPPGATGLRPYPGQYVYPSLDKVDTTSYRRFHPEAFDAGAIQFDTQHTQFPAGAEAAIKFSVVNPTDAPWRQVTLRAMLLGPDGKEVGNQVVADRLDLNPRGPKLTQEVKIQLPAGVSGIFHAAVELIGQSGQVLSSNTVELGVNPLPKSVLVFCAHEDDEGTQMGFIRSLVENQVPVRVVYYTSGDAGACDRYYQHTCGPAEGLNYGPIRMQEARAALGHLGVAPEDVIFFGLPDGGTGKIWYNHPQTSDPYLAVLLASDHAPYDGLVQPNIPFARDAVVGATKAIIKQFQPGVIFTVHPPAEGHIDHIVNNFFVVRAMQELLREGAISPDVELRVDPIFDPLGHPATPYQYESHGFFVSDHVMALAQEAGWFYESQDGNHVMGTIQPLNQLPATEGYRKVLDWKEHEGWNEKE
jgi:LmbE family N-acetylglucosaminyl deacetylase